MRNVKQVNFGNGNKQVSNDPNTTQIQIGAGLVGFALISLVVVLGAFAYFL